MSSCFRKAAGVISASNPTDTKKPASDTIIHSSQSRLSIKASCWVIAEKASCDCASFIAYMENRPARHPASHYEGTWKAAFSGRRGFWRYPDSTAQALNTLYFHATANEGHENRSIHLRRNVPIIAGYDWVRL